MEGTQKQVNIDLCFDSSFNPRKTKDETQVQRLAQRIQKYGFEQTRALWAREVNGKYEIFAGSMRLAASRIAGIETITILVAHDSSDDNIAFLTDFDNENDEYHTPISPVDTWAEYARLKGLGWKQERIAKAKGVARSTVAERLQFHAVSDKVKGYVSGHKHFKKSLPVTRKTDFHLKEHGEMRLTDKYQVFHWTEFAKLKAWILNGA